MKTFKQFQEAALAIPAAAGVASKVLPAAAAIIGGVGTYMQAKKKRKLSAREKKLFGLEKKAIPHLRDKNDKLPADTILPKKGEARKTEALIRKHEKLNQIIKPKEGDATKERELLKKKEKEITKPKVGEKKDASKTVKNYLKVRKKEGETAYRLKQDAEISDKGPGKLLPTDRKRYLDRLLSNFKKNKNIPEEAAIVNSLGGGKIAGTVEAGDDPPVNKKKKKCKPTIIARGCMPGARSRFKGGVELIASLKKNKYT